MTQKVTLKIKGMECPNCSLTLEQIEDKLDGILFAEASYRKEQLVVEFDETIVSLDRIKSEVSRLGYLVTGSL